MNKPAFQLAGTVITAALTASGCVSTGEFEKVQADKGQLEQQTRELQSQRKAVLSKVGEALKGYEDKVIRVVGHTDNVPISTAQFPSNWELSAARATTVVRFLQSAGVAPERLTASGRGEFSPVASNDDAEGRRKNRRIEITPVDRNVAQEVQSSGAK